MPSDVIAWWQPMFNSVLAATALIVGLGTIFFNYRASRLATKATAQVQKDISENDLRKIFVGEILGRLKTMEDRVATLETQLVEERDRHIKDLEQMRAERDQVRQEKHDQAAEFYTTVREYEQKLADMELRHHDEIAEMKRQYELDMQKLTDKIAHLEEQLRGQTNV